MSSSRTLRDWDRFAAREPHFAVVTDPRFLQANLTPERERAFFASGESLVAWMLAVIDASLLPQFAPMSTLEFGCGIGRLALPLAQRPGAVTAVDRSEPMLARARQEAERRGLGHVLFQRPEECLAAARRFDLVVCYHVLQRLARQDGLALLRRLLAAVGSDGVGVFQWPYRSRDAAAVRASRRVREAVPGVNAALNRWRGKAAGDPFVPTRTYAVDEMLGEFEAAGLNPVHLVTQRHERLDYAVAFVRRPGPGASRRSERPVRPAAAEVTAPADLDGLNAAADAYFASLTTWDHHLAKPFSQIEETPTLLSSVAVLLQALRLTRGTRVLEFGAGSGWLSRFLTQMGCEVVLLDVSATALRIAREHYARLPIVGEQPAPAFLHSDGRRIDLPDASVDRIVCFDAFHHAPNPHAVIGEFGRVLRPGGIAGFVEPGPRHADAPRSQFESQTYGVVERDVDVHDIRRTARAAGFADLRMCVFHAPPHHVSLEEYEELLAGGPAQDEWLSASRRFLRHVRSFYLVKEGTASADSRGPAGLACAVRTGAADRGVSGDRLELAATVSNTGTTAWLPSGIVPGGVALGAHLYDAAGALLAFDFAVWPLTDPPREVAPGESVACRIVLPPLARGTYRVELDCVSADVTWFAQAGSRPAQVAIEIV